MKVSASLELVWQIAGQEAKASRFGAIEPEHFCMAVMKLAELPVQDAEKIAGGAEAARDLARDVAAVRDALGVKNIDGKQTRRAIRAKLGKGNAAPDDGRMHRSDASRALFDAAAKLADEGDGDTLTPAHLLEALLTEPTDMIAQVLADAPANPDKAKRAPTPLLAEMGQDLTEMAREGKLRAVSDRRAECSALLTALEVSDNGSVFLVCDKDDPVRSVVAAAAHAIADGSAPEALTRHRIVDVTSHRPAGKDAAKWKERMQALLREASADGKTILFWPPVTAASKGLPPSLELMVAREAKDGPRSVCRLTRGAYEKHVKSVATWRQRAQAIWIRNERAADIPTEL
jgi:ATP-dependent Clp protease ATP-binding subunit ClpA